MAFWSNQSYAAIASKGRTMTHHEGFDLYITPIGQDKRPNSPEKIKEARMFAGLTQEQAAKVLDRSRRSWQSWETGARAMDPWLLRLFRVRTGQDRPESLLNDCEASTGLPEAST